MIIKTSIPGKKYTLHIRDARSIPNGQVEIRFSDNKLQEVVGCCVLDGRSLDVDELMEAYFNAKPIVDSDRER
jgi:hypothetical protein